jgi:transcriptional regulator with XRE-family HTH domain
VYYLKFRRIELNLTGREVARKARIWPQTLSDIERGRTNPTAEELNAIARALGCPPERLMVPVDATPLGDGAEFRDTQRERANG